MEKVTGIGGFFFRAKDSKALAAWYRDHLGVTPIPEKEGDVSWRQEAGTTAFGAFPESTKYFGNMQKMWMINFRVKNLEAMVAQLRAAGIQVDTDKETYPYGLFARLHDPEGNPVELWQPDDEN